MQKSHSPMAAIYARVSSEQQAEAATIASQVAALEERATHDGLSLEPELRFLDEGYSGATLIRPALERLRDMAATGVIDRVYIHSPDRLARKYAYQVLLLDEFCRCGVEVVFLNHPLGQTPEDDLLLQVQGMVAEYERAKIVERSRRGKLHAARQGSVSVLGGAPYGYRYVSGREGDGEARYEILLEEARVTRQMYEWVGRDGLSISGVCRRLKERGIPSPTGQSCWNRATVWHQLKNAAYRGTAIFGKTRIGPKRPRLRAARGRPEQPRRGHSFYAVPEDEGIPIAVPAIVSEALFAAVQERLEENPQRIEREYQRRLERDPQGIEDGQQLQARIHKVKGGIARLVDAYEAGLLEKREFEPRIRRSRDRLAHLEADAKKQVEEEAQRVELRLVIGRLQEFADRIQSGLRDADWPTQREILRALVKRVEVDEAHIRVIYRVDSLPFDQGPAGGRLQDCLRRERTCSECNLGLRQTAAGGR